MLEAEERANQGDEDDDEELGDDDEELGRFAAVNIMGHHMT